MTFRVVFLDSAEQDLKELKRYIVRNFGRIAWQNSYREIRTSIAALKLFPLSGRVPDELRNLQLSRYRQVIAGRNRIIYELRQDTIFIHIVCDARKDLRTVLITRLLRPRV
ncbi:type II toxin-antitoxin system RelE/ParE family toxin [Massilia sp. TWR1-2-2]|uniref:type II toxin-antitoxin system RelE/ParE family toxin n=1 Tax=Massilia sp. TWR1-2-2 TaxID=2804584 RepID=UPI003CF62B54